MSAHTVSTATLTYSETYESFSRTLDSLLHNSEAQGMVTVTEVSRGFPKVFQENAVALPKMGNDQFHI
jgi:hypothetical protein